MSDIIAYKDQSNEYFDVEVDNSTPVKAKSEDALNIMRHDMAHVLAEAVTTIFPNAKPTIGPFIKNGFYYDFDMENTLSDSDLNNIESKITDILKEGRNFTKKTVSKDQALELFKDNEYKIELIKNLDNSSEINLYEQENFTDLCKDLTIKVQKNMMLMLKLPVYLVLTGDISTNKMLQRIYATAFYSEKDLNKY